MRAPLRSGAKRINEIEEGGLFPVLSDTFSAARRFSGRFTAEGKARVAESAWFPADSRRGTVIGSPLSASAFARVDARRGARARTASLCPLIPTAPRERRINTSVHVLARCKRLCTHACHVCRVCQVYNTPTGQVSARA